MYVFGGAGVNPFVRLIELECCWEAFVVSESRNRFFCAIKPDSILAMM